MNENNDFMKTLRERLTLLERQREDFDVKAQTSYSRKMGEYDGRIAELQQFLLVLDDDDGELEEIVEPASVGENGS